MACHPNDQVLEDSNVIYERMHEFHGGIALEDIVTLAADQGWGPGRAAAAAGYLTRSGFATLRAFRGRTYLDMANPAVTFGWARTTSR